MRNVLSLSAALAALAFGSAAVAQAPTMPPTPPPARPSILGHLFHRPGQTAMPGHTMVPMSGGIVGNKNSHVYHLPGDKGSMPSAQNRVSFRTEAEAVAAGYHKAGSTAGVAHPMMGGIHHKPMTPTH